MTTVSNQCAKGRANDNYGAKLECPSMHPGLAASVLPWAGGADFKESMLNIRRLSSFIVLTRDRGSGEVRLDKEGNPRLYYPLAESDAENMMDGLETAVRAMAAAGVDDVCPTNLPSARVLPPQSMPEARAAAVDNIVTEMRETGFPLFKSSVFSAHQMGTCRMGSSSKDSVVNEDGQSWEVSGLYVADASTFPTSSGVNPMVTTLAIAHSVSQRLKRTFRPSSRL
jgi:long-chain-alcohol oxidase